MTVPIPPMPRLPLGVVQGAGALLSTPLLAPLLVLLPALLLGGVAGAQVSPAPAAVVVPRAAGEGDDPLVARINGRALHLSDVHASIESLSLGDQIEVRDQLGTYIEAVINEEVLFQWALRTDFAEEPGLRKEIKDLVVRHLIEKHVRGKIRVTEADARAYYGANPSLVRGEHVRVRRIRLSTRAQCEGLAAQIDSEEAFIAAARKHSLDESTRAEGGDAGLMMRGEGPREGYELELFRMQPGEMRIFDVPQGCVLVRSTFYVNPPLPPFSAVRSELLQYLRNREEVQLVDRLFRRASVASRVERFYQAPLSRGGIAPSRGTAGAAPTAAPAPRGSGGTSR